MRRFNWICVATIIAATSVTNSVQENAASSSEEFEENPFWNYYLTGYPVSIDNIQQSKCQKQSRSKTNVPAVARLQHSPLHSGGKCSKCKRFRNQKPVDKNCLKFAKK